MAGRKTLEQQLADIHAVSLGDPASSESEAVLHAAINSRSSHAAARAATVVGEHALVCHEAALLAAFQRFLPKGSVNDKGCTAKLAIVEALGRCGVAAWEVFLQGAACIQIEPVFGGQVDTASPLRGSCCGQLAVTGYDRTLDVIASTLADSEREARIGAARAVRACVSPGGSAVLRLRIALGDEPEAMLEYAESLLSIDSDAVEWIGGLLAAVDGADADAFALALGRSRLDAALPILAGRLTQTLDEATRRSTVAALVSMRRDDAYDALATIVAHGPTATAMIVIEALTDFAFDPRVCEKLRDAAKYGGDPHVMQAAAEAFGDDGN